VGVGFIVLMSALYATTGRRRAGGA
jgi:hypothetical protein